MSPTCGDESAPKVLAAAGMSSVGPDPLVPILPPVAWVGISVVAAMGSSYNNSLYASYLYEDAMRPI